MSYTVPTSEPTIVFAGDRVRWEKSISEYPATAESWTLTYYLFHQTETDARVVITATASGDTHVIDEATSTTLAWLPGKYHWRSFVSDGTSRHQVADGSLEVKPNFATYNSNYDGRTYARKILDALLEIQLERASEAETNYSLGAAGRSTSYKSDIELQESIRFWQAEVAKEDAQAAIDRGDSSGNNILVQFTNY